MIRKVITLAILIVFSLTGYAWAASSLADPKPFSSKRPFMPGEIIVKFKNVPGSIPAIEQPQAGSMSAAGTGTKAGKVRIKKLFKNGNKQVAGGMGIATSGDDKIDEPGTYKFSLEGRDDIYTVVDELKKDPNVEYAEPNYLYQTSFVPNDPNYSQQWAYAKIGAPAAWDVSKGSSEVVIAIIDTGVDYGHPDLAPNMWRNTKEIPGNGIDDDHNGYVDDVMGWDCVNVPSDWVAEGEDPGPADNDPMDFLGHGTHVAGIAAGLPNNGLGIAGTAWNCKIMPLRAGYLCYDGGGYLELDSITEAIYYAANNGANVINMSFGSLCDSSMMREAIEYAHSKGVTMVASAGNVDVYDQGMAFYPAAYDHVVAVSAVDETDRISLWNYFAFSNYGEFVDISAPGTYILSTLPGNSYGYASGTSMASPFVAGVAALVKSKHPDWTPDQIEAWIKQTSDYIYGVNPEQALAGKLGAGRVSAKRALGNLSMAITYPKPSSIISGSVAVKGDADMDNFTSYKLEYANVASPDVWAPIVNMSDKPVHDGILGLWSVSDPNGSYNLKVTVKNSSGESFECISGVNFGVNGEVKLEEKPMCGPSPFDPNRSQFTFYYKLMNASDVDIYVYDIGGTLIWQKTLPNDSANSGHGGGAGTNRVYWDGEDSFGSTLGNGAYVYMIIANDSGERKIIGRGKFAVVRS